MLRELWANLQAMFAPYSFEQYVKDNNPQTIHELEKLERDFTRLSAHFCFSPKY